MWWVANLFGFFLIMNICMVLAIVRAKKGGSGYFYFVGAVVQLVGIIGTNYNREYSYNPYPEWYYDVIWIVYLFILTLTAIIVLKRKHKSEKFNNKTDEYEAIVIKNEDTNRIVEDSFKEKKDSIVIVEKRDNTLHPNGLHDPSSNTIEEKKEEHRLNIEPNQQFCNACGGNIDNKTKRCKLCGKKYKHIPILLVIVLSFFLALSVLLNIYQGYVKQENTRKIDDLYDSISQENLKNSKLEKEVNEQAASIASFSLRLRLKEIDADNYKAILNGLSMGNLGYASNNFKSSESIILLDKDQKDKKFTLTANWSNGGTVYTTYSPNIPTASLSFDNKSWDTSTTMTITPIKEGVTTVTFSNNVDNLKFNVIIIVK